MIKKIINGKTIDLTWMIINLEGRSLKKNEKVELDCDKSVIKEEPHQKCGFIIDNKMNNVIEDLVKSEYNELISFLESIDMMKYFDLFQKNCLDDLATILG